MQQSKNWQAQSLAGLFTLSLRLVVGWTYFSALWRRLVLADKLDPESAGYIGEKFNHFLPNALGIKPLIEYMVTHPDLLWWAMVIFTIVEGIVGLFIMLGLFTRIMSVGVFGLALGILLGSGWIGTTCLDEWQIGILGIATGFTLFLTGSSYYSLDFYLLQKYPSLLDKKWFRWIGSGEFPYSFSATKKLVLYGSLLIFGLSLFTNQYFHGGIWGTLHNKSVSPELEISNMVLSENQLAFDLFRYEGVDVYGSYLIEIQVLDEYGKILKNWKSEDFKTQSDFEIDNYYITQIIPDDYSLVVPLGAKAKISIDLSSLTNQSKIKAIKLIDVSGKSWQKTL